MFSRLTIILDNSKGFDYRISSLLQGVLMEFIPTEYADKLHEDGLKPYTQYVRLRDNELIWTITALSREAKENVIEPIANSGSKEIFLEHKDTSLKILRQELRGITYRELMNETFFGNCSRIVTLRFLTPTAFKVDGKYQFHPTVEHVMSSLIRKHDSVSQGTEIYSEELMKQISEDVNIIGYKLQSINFHLEGVKIPSFIGSITIRIGGQQQFVNLINMVCAIGEYSGVGIKTAIGMGALSAEQKRKGRKIEREAN